MGSTDYHERRIATKGVERPFVVAEIQTGADIPRRLACQGSSPVWVSGIDDVIEAWSLQDGSCVTDICKTRSARRPTDLAISPKGRVVYSDHYKRKILKWVKGRIKGNIFYVFKLKWFIGLHGSVSWVRSKERDHCILFAFVILLCVNLAYVTLPLYVQSVRIFHVRNSFHHSWYMRDVRNPYVTNW